RHVQAYQHVRRLERLHRALARAHGRHADLGPLRRVADAHLVDVRAELARRRERRGRVFAPRTDVAQDDKGLAFLHAAELKFLAKQLGQPCRIERLRTHCYSPFMVRKPGTDHVFFRLGTDHVFGVTASNVRMLGKTWSVPGFGFRRFRLGYLACPDPAEAVARWRRRWPGNPYSGSSFPTCI